MNIKASIVIPVKNGGSQLALVLGSIFTQKVDFDFEVIAIDSGSTDESVAVIKAFSCTLLQIKPEDFGHGKTRNIGAMNARGEYVVFITQDALPASDKWLQFLIDAMEIDKEIVGGFGIHYPYPDCNIFDKRDIEGLFKSFGTDTTIMYLDDKEKWENNEEYKQRLCFFSDNNACVRRDYFLQHPYPDVNYAEDQIWMRGVMEAGKKKVYCPLAPVFHSHNYPLNICFKRYYDDYKGLQSIHGYRLAKSWREVFEEYKKLVSHDYTYIKSIKMETYEKRRTLFYIIRRHMRRCVAGYIGGSYHLYSQEKQQRYDKKFSQQYQQRQG